MDGVSTAIAAFCAAAMATPFVLDYQRRARKGAQLLRALQHAAKQHRGRIHRHEHCGDITLGLDRENRVLYFHSQREGAEGTRFVPLHQVRSCKAVTHTHGSKEHARVDHVELSFTPTNAAEGPTRMVLYQAGPGTMLNGEVQLAEAWAARVNALLA